MKSRFSKLKVKQQVVLREKYFETIFCREYIHYLAVVRADIKQQVAVACAEVNSKWLWWQMCVGEHRLLTSTVDHHKKSMSSDNLAAAAAAAGGGGGGDDARRLPVSPFRDVENDEDAQFVAGVEEIRVSPVVSRRGYLHFLEESSSGWIKLWVVSVVLHS